ncbi:hypothetical protein Hanom_Chr02g00176311 [Helianthus anomalus]
MGDLRNKSTKEKTSKKSKQSSEDVNEEKKTEKRNSDVFGGRERKRYDAYKALFKSQRIRTESGAYSYFALLFFKEKLQILSFILIPFIRRCPF